MNINDKVIMKGRKGKIISIKHAPILLVDFENCPRPLRIHEKDLVKE